MREVTKQARECALAALFNDAEWDKSAGVGMSYIELEGSPQQFREWMDEALRAALAVMPGFEHYSDCAVHRGPAYPAGECDCGARTDAAWNEAIDAAVKWHIEQAEGERALADPCDPKSADYKLHVHLAAEHMTSAAVIRNLRRPA